MLWKATVYKPYSNDVMTMYEKIEIEAENKATANSKVVSKIKAYLRNGDNSWVDAKITKIEEKK